MTRVQAKTSAAARETECRVIMMESPARMRREENTDSPARMGRIPTEDRRHRADRAGMEPLAAQMGRTPAKDSRFRADRVCPVLPPGEAPAAGSP